VRCRRKVSLNSCSQTAAASNTTSVPYTLPKLTTSDKTSPAATSTGTGLASYILSALGVTAAASTTDSDAFSSESISSTVQPSTVGTAIANNTSISAQNSSSGEEVSNAAVTAPALLRNGSLPAPYTTWHNHTYATSCAYNDPTCLSACYSFDGLCSSEWTTYMAEATILASSLSTSIYLDPHVSTIAHISANSTYTFTQTNTFDGATNTFAGTSVIALASGTPSYSTSYSPFTYSFYGYSYSNTQGAASPGCKVPDFGHEQVCTSACNPNHCTVSGGKHTNT
jgi:hypothetical protein